MLICLYNSCMKYLSAGHVNRLCVLVVLGADPDVPGWIPAANRFSV
jgi:hypothetical protein